MEKNRWFIKRYHCPECDTSWQDEWDCLCNDKCYGCGREYEPEEWEEVDPNTGEVLDFGTARVAERQTQRT